jgi:SAM-dependent methyltransferase
MHANSRLLFLKYALAHFQPSIRVLEIGPDQVPSTYRSLVRPPPLDWDTLDIEARSGVTYLAESEYSFPVADESYDIVFSAQVIEHVRRIWLWMPEVARVCRSGGIVITINPVSWPFHEAPIDCWRAYPDGMKALYEDASIEVLLSRCESLEAPNYRRYIPGRSAEFKSRKGRLTQRVLGPLGFPVERAYDTITIGRKRRPVSPVPRP